MLWEVLISSLFLELSFLQVPIEGSVLYNACLLETQAFWRICHILFLSLWTCPT